MWTDPVLSSAIMETMESTRRSVVCITDVLGSIAVPLLRHRVRGIGDVESVVGEPAPRQGKEGTPAGSVNAKYRTCT
jgi:hypothetical protein